MPVIKIEYDDTKVKENAVVAVSNAIQKIVSETTGIEDVFVYANSSRIKVKIAPIEIWVEMSANKIEDVEKLLSEFKEKLSTWKKKDGFQYPINLTLTPVPWKFEIGI
jgi:hypothetical protein